MPTIPLEKMQSNVQLLKQALMLPKDIVSEETVRKEEKDRAAKTIKQLRKEIAVLNKKIAKLPAEVEEAKALEQNILIKKREVGLAEKKLKNAAAAAKKIQTETGGVAILLSAEIAAVAKNENEMLGQQTRDAQARAARTQDRGVAKAQDIVLEKPEIPIVTLKEIYNTESLFLDTDNEDLKKNQAEVKLIFKKYENEPAASMVALEQNEYQAISKLLAKQKDIVLEKPEIPMVTLKEIYNTESLFLDTDNEDLKKNQAEVKLIFKKYENEPAASMVALEQSEYQAISKLLAKQKPKIPMVTLQQIYNRKSLFLDTGNENFKKIQAVVELIFKKYENEPAASMVTLEQHEYEAVSDFLAKQRASLAEKIEDAASKAKEKDKTTGEENRQKSPELEAALAKEQKCQQDSDKAVADLAETQEKLQALSVVSLQKELQEKTTKLESYAKPDDDKSNPMYNTVSARMNKINEKKLLHKKTSKEITDQIIEPLKKQGQSIHSDKPDIERRLEADFQKKLGASEAAVETAVQYCIGELEQVSPKEQKALKKKCEEAGWDTSTEDFRYFKSNNFLQMSEMRELTYNTYLKNGGKAIPRIAMPDALKEAIPEEKATKKPAEAKADKPAVLPTELQTPTPAKPEEQIEKPAVLATPEPQSEKTTKPPLLPSEPPSQQSKEQRVIPTAKSETLPAEKTEVAAEKPLQSPLAPAQMAVLKAGLKPVPKQLGPTRPPEALTGFHNFQNQHAHEFQRRREEILAKKQADQISSDPSNPRPPKLPGS